MTTLAVVLTKEKGATLQPNPQLPAFPPKPGKGEVLIRNVAVASNPKDWKLSKVGIFEGIEGNDVAGFVEAVGEGVTSYKKGDKVGAFTRMSTNNSYGAYQSFSVSPANTVFPLGPKTSFEEASTLPLAAMTAAIGLFARLAVPEPSADGAPNKANEGKGILVWGASSSVGAFAVQLAKKAGLYVIGVAGAAQDLAKELGCDAVVDYRSSRPVSELLKEAIAKSGKQFSVAYDAHSALSGKTTSYYELAAALQPAGGKVTVVLGVPKKESAKLPPNVQVIPTQVGTAHSKDGALAEKWFHTMARWLEEGKFRANRVRVIPGGLAGVKEGLKLMEEGKVSGEKLVYRIAETPDASKL
ncbi:chaperonin 10-like protein [Hyaloraphidium curvatum]|nr:chaperonin 10-like protein [Hyaloraphidium curvatum]